MKKILAIWIAVVAGCALIATGCGSDDEGSATSAGAAAPSTTTASATYSAADVERATRLGVQVAERAGGRADLPEQTVGIVTVANGIEGADRVTEAMHEALDAVGWRYKVCDGAGDPAKQINCGNSLLAQNVDALATIAIEPSAIEPVLRSAKAKGIPAFQAGGAVADNPLQAGNYAQDDSKQGQIAATYLIDRLTTAGDDAQLAINDFPAAFARKRTDALREDLKSDPGIEIVADQVADGQNLVEGTRKQVGDTLTAHPDLKGYWFSFDTAGQAGGQAVQSKYPGRSFPDRPLVVTFNALQSTQDLIESGAIDAVADANFDAAAWVGVDQLTGLVARRTPMSREQQPEYPIEIYQYSLVTRDNLPTGAPYVEPRDDYRQFFKSKWAAEFGS